ncbi:unnamed protein product [Callosobruchus maculatus]|uniref:Myb-like, SWIRM and MPN domain-containing protein 1 n=1 Tax=Callosobruchus maculatus TaxID=64391 RepID=A0A653C441_CALMS|nr:unnamed protein product [Callosobruchus maculatus]
MADDDEIDILGEFNLGSFLSKSSSSIYDPSDALVSQNADILNCDFTIHPQWLLDKPSANPDNWYNSNNLSMSLLEKTQLDNDNLGHMSTENSITDESGWTEKEKNLLERGIEIFGKSNVRLAQFIGSKTPSEVRYYMKNFYIENHSTERRISDGFVGDVASSQLVDDVLEDNQIPASMEEVIAAVSTAKPTVSSQSQKPFKKKTYQANYQAAPFRAKTRIASGSSVKMKNKKIKDMKPKNKTPKIKYKFRQEMNMNKDDQIIIHNADTTKGSDVVVPLCEGEEIIILKKADESESDVDVDVEISDDESPSKSTVSIAKASRNNLTFDEAPEKPDLPIDNINKTSDSQEQKPDIDLTKLDSSTTKQLTSLDEPQYELIIDEDSISQLEKVIHNDYFQGKIKTPERYMYIRNNILKNWRSIKPKYLSKTTCRASLKKTGDVNSIGRIHTYLEQIGAINYGCEQVVYARPLSNLIYVPLTSKEKNEKKTTAPRVPTELGARQRMKNKKYTNDGEGGCTLTHDERGQIVNTTVVNEEPKQKLYIKRPTIKLIYCRPFTVEKPQPFKVKMNLATLLTIDFHAHAWLTEVMGLVAGSWVPQENLLKITHYEPCLNIASSTTHCDMCPISQAEAADFIHKKRLDILGWFHSHPTFAPEPSQQDMDTQMVVQRWIGHGKPCIGVILSPFSLNGALIASPFRCLIVDQKENFEDQFVPYKFKVDIDSDTFELVPFLEDLKRVHKAGVGCSNERRVDFTKPYYKDSKLSFLDKVRCDHLK